jgi:hypothetical protein
MSKRLVYLGLGALLIAMNSGCCGLTDAICCWHDSYLARYQATHFSDCGCGETFYNSWYNSPPKCCDPCDDYGNYTGRKWWVPCFGCGGGGGCGGGCGCGGGLGTCPGVGPAGRTYGPGMGMNNSGYYDDGSVNPATVSPAPAEEVQPGVPNQMSRGNGQGTYQPMPAQPNGSTRTSRYPRNMQRQQPPQRMSRRMPTRPTNADVVPTGYQDSDAVYDDGQTNSNSGYRVSTGTANYRR